MAGSTKKTIKMNKPKASLLHSVEGIRQVYLEHSQQNIRLLIAHLDVMCMGAALDMQF